MAFEKEIVAEIVGRGKKNEAKGKYACIDWVRNDADEAPVLDFGEFNPSEKPFYAVMFEQITKMLKRRTDGGAKNMAINIFAPRSGVTLKYYQIAAQVSIANRTGVEPNWELLLKDCKSDYERAVITDFTNTLKSIVEAGTGNVCRVNDIDLLNYVELQLPEGCYVEKGTALNFVNSEAKVVDEKGTAFTVKARWNKFNRENASVEVRGTDEEHPVYAIKLSNDPTGYTKELITARAELYKLVPEDTRNVVQEALAKKSA